VGAMGININGSAVIRAGMPTAIACGGTSCKTTALAPIFA